MTMQPLALAGAWNSHDVERILTFYTDDILFEDVALEQIKVGKQDFRQALQEFFATFSDIHIEIKSFIDVEDMAGGEWVMTGVRTDTGKSFSIQGVSVFEFQEGKIARNSEYYNPASLMP